MEITYTKDPFNTLRDNFECHVNQKVRFPTIVKVKCYSSYVTKFMKKRSISKIT